MSLKNDPASVVADPEWLPSHCDWRASEFDFVHLPRSGHSDVTFLDDEYLIQLRLPSVRLAISDVVAARPPSAAPPHYLFHSAFCCSTLLARALDLPGTAMTLREPQVLGDLASAARVGALKPDLVRLTIGLLARPFGNGERVVIKPSNSVNLLATAMLELSPGANAIFLYAPLPRFLRSVADKGLWGRIWVRKLFATLSKDTGLDFGLGAEGLFELTDLQLAAVAWLMHHAQAASLIARFPGRVRTLDSEIFLAKRNETLLAASALFGFGLSPEQAEAAASGPAFATHSKELGRSFDSEQTLQPKARVSIIEEEIGMIVAWAETVANHSGIPVELPTSSALLRTK